MQSERATPPLTKAGRPRRKSGPKPLPADQKRQRTLTLSAYLEDEAALDVLREAGYEGGFGPIIRRVLRERAAEVAQAQEAGRLAL